MRHQTTNHDFQLAFGRALFKTLAVAVRIKLPGAATTSCLQVIVRHTNVLQIFEWNVKFSRLFTGSTFSPPKLTETWRSSRKT
jgi:hypothetical protein